MGPVTVTLQLRNSLDMTLLNNKTNRRLGCEFVGISRGNLAAVHAVGQPNPTRSHFAAMEVVEDADGVALMHKHYTEQMFVSTRLYPGVEETLKHFAGKRRAVVTSKETRFVELILDRFGITGEFDCIIGGDTVPERKPNPLPVIEAIRRLGGQPSDTVMIGDSENDINAGRRAETRTSA